MVKRLRKARSLCCCCSPRLTSNNTHQSIFNRYEEDVWTEIAKFMDGKSMVMLAATCKWFHHVMMEDSVWKYACLRDLQVPDPGNVEFKWIKLYATAFDGSHSYMFHQKEKYIDLITTEAVELPNPADQETDSMLSLNVWIDVFRNYWTRIGAFFFDSDGAFLTGSLIAPLRISKEEVVEQMLEKDGNCVLCNIKTGIWIADLQLVRCPACDLDTCDGTMQTLEARHIELFLWEEYQGGSWEYDTLGTYNIQKQADGASSGIFDIKHLKNRSISDILDLKSWTGKRNEWHPKAIRTLHAVAVNTNLQENDGLQIKYHAMKAGKEGEVVAIRISHQLL